jgi:magnesium-protoporphyrin O-methyltransferase
MVCKQCCAIESVFDQKTASNELKDYRKKGAQGSTRLLIDALKMEGVEGLTLLDIGGGVGVIQHELFKAGISAATDVDASTAYLRAAQEEAARLGNADRTAFHHGNFVDIAAELEPVDVVTLDRVICCYPDMYALVSRSAERAKKFYAVVFPHDGWLMRLGSAGANLWLRVSGNPFRAFIHPTAEVDAILESHGLKRRYHRRSGLFWQVIVYART